MSIRGKVAIVTVIDPGTDLGIAEELAKGGVNLAVISLASRDEDLTPAERIGRTVALQRPPTAERITGTAISPDPARTAP